MRTRTGGPVKAEPKVGGGGKCETRPERHKDALRRFFPAKEDRIIGFARVTWKGEGNRRENSSNISSGGGRGATDRINKKLGTSLGKDRRKPTCPAALYRIIITLRHCLRANCRNFSRELARRDKLGLVVGGGRGRRKGARRSVRSSSRTVFRSRCFPKQLKTAL